MNFNDLYMYEPLGAIDTLGHWIAEGFNIEELTEL